MKCCEKCGVIVPSSRERCPLCQRVLVESDATGYDAEISPTFLLCTENTVC